MEGFNNGGQTPAHGNEKTAEQLRLDKAINTAVDETVDLLDLYAIEYRDSVGVPMQKGIEDLKILLRQRFASYH